MLKAGIKKRQINCRLSEVNIMSGLSSQNQTSQHKTNQHKTFEKTLSYVVCLYL